MPIDIDFDRDGVPSPFVPPPADLADLDADAEYRAWLDDQEAAWEERVRASYAARGMSNIY